MPTWVVHGVDTDVYTAGSPTAASRRSAPETQRHALDRLPLVLEDAEQSAGDALTALAAIQYNADELSQQVFGKPGEVWARNGPPDSSPRPPAASPSPGFLLARPRPVLWPLLQPLPRPDTRPARPLVEGDGRCCVKRRPAKPPRSGQPSLGVGVVASADKGAASLPNSGPSGRPARLQARVPTTIRRATPRGSPRGQGVHTAAQAPARRPRRGRTAWPKSRGGSDQPSRCAVRATVRGRMPAPTARGRRPLTRGRSPLPLRRPAARGRRLRRP